MSRKYNIKLKMALKVLNTKNNFSWGSMKELVDTLLENNLPTFAQKIELNLPKLNLPKL